MNTFRNVVRRLCFFRSRTSALEKTPFCQKYAFSRMNQIVDKSINYNHHIQ
jgi:hypothetical protein